LIPTILGMSSLMKIGLVLGAGGMAGRALHAGVFVALEADLGRLAVGAGMSAPRHPRCHGGPARCLVDTAVEASGSQVAGPRVAVYLHVGT
jgi:hypothetical protein